MSEAIKINLLDWRAEAREAKRRRFIALLGAVAIATIVIVGVLPDLYYNHQLSDQNARNDYLSAQIATENSKLAKITQLTKTRNALVDRMQVIAELQQSRSSIVHYFDQLVKTLPQGVYLTALSQSAETTTLQGIADSNALVSQYMINLDNSPWFTNPQLIVITRDDSGAQPRAAFTLTVESVDPNAPSKPATAAGTSSTTNANGASATGSAS